MRRAIMLVMVLALAGCQSASTDYSAKPKECDRRAIDSGLCVPDEYESE